MKTICILLTFTALTCFIPQKPFTVYSIGDSTMCDLPTDNNAPGRGWMQMIKPFFDGNVTVQNYGKSGRSSKSYRSEGYWNKVINMVQPGDYVFIQFGHNDEKPDTARHTDPRTSFRENLMNYIKEVEAKGAHPILFTSIVRRSFDPANNHLKDTHGEYVTVVRELAKEKNIPLVDLNTSTGALVDSMGPEASKKLYIYVNPGVIPSLPDGKKDDTHLCIYGASEFARLAAEGLKALKLPLSEHIVLNK
jgi:lysophospholipase L1-like esterase